MTSDVESLAQSIVDEAMEAGEYITEDPKRLAAFLDSYDSEEAIIIVTKALGIISVGMALAHVRTSDAQDPLRTVALAAWVADRFISKAKEGFQ